MMTPTMLMVPAGKPGLPPIQIDLTKIHTIERRIPEVAFVTPQKAPELLAVFNDAFLDLTRDITLLRLQYDDAVRHYEKLKAVIILDKAPQILKQKGLTKDSNPAGSADLREAVLNADDEYTEAVSRADHIKAMMELMKGKLDSIKMAYDSVKKILGENAYNFSPNLSSGHDSPNTSGTPDAVWGTTRYK